MRSPASSLPAAPRRRPNRSPNLPVSASLCRQSFSSRSRTRPAFAAFAAARLDESYRLARRILGDDHEAQDATHDAFVAAWRNRRALRHPERVDAWFGRILVNACRERLRRGARRPTVVLSTIRMCRRLTRIGTVTTAMRSGARSGPSIPTSELPSSCAFTGTCRWTRSPASCGRHPEP